MFGFLFFLTMVYCWRGKAGREARNQADWICFLLGRWLSEFLVTDCQSHLYKGDESKWTRSLVDRVPKTALFTQVTYKGQSFPFCVSDGGSFHLSILKHSVSSNGFCSCHWHVSPSVVFVVVLYFVVVLFLRSMCLKASSTVSNRDILGKFHFSLLIYLFLPLPPSLPVHY